jgi:hypothetical protein
MASQLTCSEKGRGRETNNMGGAPEWGREARSKGLDGARARLGGGGWGRGQADTAEEERESKGRGLRWVAKISVLDGERDDLTSIKKEKRNCVTAKILDD